jgi:TetR/AcrR family transcriptional regulator
LTELTRRSVDWTVRRQLAIKEYRVKEILEAAHRIVGRFGYAGTTIDRVANEARIAKGTIYLHFPNKEELLHSALVEGIRDLNKELAAGDDPTAPSIQRVANLIRTMFRIQRSHEDFFKALILCPAL